MIDQFINYVIRPPRASYNPDQYLWEKDFTLAGRGYERQDVELTNERGHILRCSHYVPSPYPVDTPLPCVIYCHGNSGCRVDANEAAIILLPSNITLFTLDFSGSGLSDGEFVSLGWHERDDLRVVVSHLRSNEQVSRIGLWGRSMGSVTSLLYGSEDPSIAGMVLDSAFSILFDLMLELVDVYRIRLPKFTVKMGLKHMRRVIQKKAKFDIMKLNCLEAASKTFIPVLFGHANDDKFINPRHSDLIHKLYAGDKNIIKFDGDHNSSRPQFFYDSVSIFFYNTLSPPQVSASCSSKPPIYSNLENLKLDDGIEESLLYDIIAHLHITSTGASSSSSAPPITSATKSVGEIPSKDKLNCEKEGGCSYTSSARLSWGRCSSLGGSDSADFEVAKDSQEMTPNVLGASTEQHIVSSPKEKKVKMRKKKLLETTPKKPKKERFRKLEAFGQRLRHCILKVNHTKHRDQ
ncbi:hypothetical protein Droror1_Dr00005535 [Drosera rotundifolia]